MHHSKILELSGVGVRKRRSREDEYSWILRGLDLTVFAGERLALIGDSGSGKTTLLRVLADLEPIREGEILFNNTPVRDLNPSDYRRKVGLVQQTPALFDVDVEYNLQFAPKLENKEFSREELISLLAKVGLGEKLLGAKVETLSVGQAMRVAIARTLSMAPSVLLMDEPTSALDPLSSHKILELVKNLSREMAMTAVLVLHDMEFAKNGADRVALLHDGRIAACTGSKEFFSNPPTDLAKRFAEGLSRGGFDA